MEDEMTEECIKCDCGHGTFELACQNEDNGECAVRRIVARCVKCGQEIIISVKANLIDELPDDYD